MTDALAERIAVALERIAAAFEGGPPPSAECAHPVECRVDESTMGYPGRFFCDPRLNGCGRRNYE